MIAVTVVEVVHGGTERQFCADRALLGSSCPEAAKTLLECRRTGGFCQVAGEPKPSPTRTVGTFLARTHTQGGENKEDLPCLFLFCLSIQFLLLPCAYKKTRSSSSWLMTEMEKTEEPSSVTRWTWSSTSFSGRFALGGSSSGGGTACLSAASSAVYSIYVT